MSRNSHVTKKSDLCSVICALHQDEVFTENVQKLDEILSGQKHWVFARYLHLDKHLLFTCVNLIHENPGADMDLLTFPCLLLRFEDVNKRIPLAYLNALTKDSKPIPGKRVSAPNYGDAVWEEDGLNVFWVSKDSLSQKRLQEILSEFYHQEVSLLSQDIFLLSHHYACSLRRAIQVMLTIART